MSSARPFHAPWLALLGVAAFLGACADYTTPQRFSAIEAEEPVNEDPLEPFNRAMYKVNSALDNVLLRPLAQIYRGIVPEPGREAVANALDNLEAPVHLANSALQGDAQNSFAVFWRFLLNSTVGIGGLFDVAGVEAGLRAREADFGQTMAVYGVLSGPYLFLPVLGPSTIRDTAGRAGDAAADPFTYAGDDYWWLNPARGGAAAVSFRAQNMKLIDDIYATSLDPYVTFRSGYLQRRTAQIQQAKNPSLMPVAPVAAEPAAAPRAD